MLDVTTIILTYNEEKHIKRCLDNLSSISKKVYVIDSPSTDSTVDICTEYPNVEVVVHKYPGNQAAQFNWAIDNLDINTEWILRLDADEYLLPELIDELRERVPALTEDVTGIEFKRRHIFMGRWVKHGIYPVVLLRMFRKGCGRYENRLMDEHIMLLHGKSVVFENDFCDHSLISISDYCQKHIGYAQREAISVLDEKYELTDNNRQNEGLGKQAQKKHKKKSSYNKQPLFWRSFAYFLYRYLLKGGFLDGKEGFLFAYIQGWWYRTLVDAKILEVEKACGNDKKKIKDYIKTNFGVDL